MALTKVPSNLDSITATTQSQGDGSTNVATTAYVDTGLANLIDSAPGNLNTLNELAAAMNDNASFFSTVLPLSGGTLTGALTGTTAAFNSGATNTVATFTSTDSGAGFNLTDDSGTSTIQTNGANLRVGVDEDGAVGSSAIQFRVDGSTKATVDSSGRVGIGNTTPQAKLHVTDGATILDMTDNGYGGLKITDDSSSDYNVNFITGRNQGNTRFNFYRSGRAQGTTPWSDTTPTKIAHFSTNSNYFVGSVGIGTDSPTAQLEIDPPSADAPIFAIRRQDHSVIPLLQVVQDSSVSQGTGHCHINSGNRDMSITTGDYSTLDKTLGLYIKTTGEVGIGTITPGKNLEINDSTVPTIRFARSNSYYWDIGHTSSDFQFNSQTGGTIMHMNYDGNVIVGSSSDSAADAKFQVHGSKSLTVGIPLGVVTAEDTASMAAGVGGSIVFTGAYLSNGTKTSLASIEGFKTNSTSGDYAGELLLKTRDNGGNAEERMRVGSSGGDPSHGRIRMTSAYGQVTYGAANGHYHHFNVDSGASKFYFSHPCEASGGFSTYSDENLKKDITPLTGALDDVAKMNGITFKWKDADNRGGGSTGKQFGVTAQNMLTVDSELPTLNKDPLYNIKDGIDENDEYYTMDYARLSPYFIEAIKELKTKLEAAEARITELEG